MSLQKTEFLLKSLALDFLHNKTFNISVLQSICEQQKVHASTSENEITKKVILIDKAFQLLKQQITQKLPNKPINKHVQNQKSNMMRNLHNMMSTLLFNISATNEDYIQQIQQQMVESTASQSFTNKEMMNRTLQKDKMAVGILRQQIQKYFHAVTEKSGYLKSLVQEISSRQEIQLKKGELGLLQTVDYLCVKYSVHNDLSEKVIQILQKHESNEEQQNLSSIDFSQKIKYLNQLLFSQSKEQQLFNMLESNPNVSIKYVLMLINANYMSTSNGKRKIFATAQKQGHEVIKTIMLKIIKRVGKLELFSEKNQQYTPFRLILMHFLNKHFEVYWQFSQIINSMVDSVLQSEDNLNNLKKIQHFFRVFLTLEHPQFQQLLKFTFGVLANKYSQPVAMDLIKKLLLNRFLLNPAFYILYCDPTQEKIHKFIQIANTVRSLFYANKAQQLASKLNQPQIIKISTDIISSLEYCLKKEKDSKQIFSANLLYVNDKIIKTTMKELYEELTFNQKPYYSPRDGANINNMVSDYSLSFSMVKNQQPTKNILSRPLIQNVSEVRLQSHTNRTNLKDNQSIRFVYDQLKEQKSQNEMPPKQPEKKQQKKSQTKYLGQRQDNVVNKSQISEMGRKQHQITKQTRINTFSVPTDRQIIQELVELRKEYGQRKKQMRSEYEARRAKSMKRILILDEFVGEFNKFREQIERDNDKLHVHMTSIA